MTNSNPLKVVAVDKNKPQVSRPSRRQEAQAKFERLWLINPEQFNPRRNCSERERIDRTWSLIEEKCDVHGKRATDLGCGYGLISEKLADKNTKVEAVDIATNALKHVKANENIIPIQDYVPRTRLEDGVYDIVVSTDLIAYLPVEEHRLYFSELARLVKSDGCVICSSPIDFNSDDSLEQFALLAETEFNIEKWILSYHRLYIQVLDFFKAPKRFAKAGKDNEYRKQEIDRRFSVGRWWFRLNSSKILSSFWSLIQWITNPIANAIKQSKWLLLFLERITRFIWPESGISHAIFFGKRRPLVMPEVYVPEDRKQKKTVWE